MLRPKNIVSFLLLSVMCVFSYAEDTTTVKALLEAEAVELVSQAVLLRDSADYNQAFALLNLALKNAEESKSPTIRAKVRNEIGVLHIYQGNYTEALSNLQLGLSIYERLGDENGIAISHAGIGSIYHDQKEYSKAKMSYEKCLRIKEKGDDKRGIANALNNMGSVSSIMGEFTEAIEYHQRSFALWEELESVSGKAITLVHIGNCLILDQKLDEALVDIAKKSRDATGRFKRATVGNLSYSNRQPHVGARTLQRVYIVVYSSA